MARKQFRIGAAGPAPDPEDLAFDLVFELEGGAERVETFHRVANLPDVVLLEMISAAGGSLQRDGARAMSDFLAVAVESSERDRFRAILRSTEAGTVKIPNLAEIVKWLTEEFLGRPTVPSSASQLTLPAGGVTSAPG